MGLCNPFFDRKFCNMFVVQSDSYEEAEAIIQDTQIGDAVLSSQNVTFIDNEGGVFVDAPLSDNSVAMVDNTDDLSLGAFLARPTLIDTTTWTTSDTTSVKTTLTPWSAFLNNTLIKKKIDNYAFLRGRLHVKIVLNGTPFQYGCVRACYTPLLGFSSSKITTPTPFANALIPYSQQPGFYVYPQANAGGEMVLPFFLHKNWLDITSLSEVNNMGTLNYVIYAPLRVALAGGSTSVTMRTYAWMTDVHLMGSTTKLALQGDEYGNGPISAPATALASMAAMLTKVPVIGRFARATEIGASAISSIATLFGFTNVPVIDNVHGFQPMNGPMLASAHISTQVQKLSLDPKQELSIDPSPHGIGSADELSLAYLKTKESLFATATWNTTDTTGTRLLNVRMNPNQISYLDVLDSVSTIVGAQVYHIPLSYIGALFKHWRGDIIIRMKIVCTKFHKGRLKISYDPIDDISLTDPPENAVYTQILDIGEEDDVELTIPYHQALAWLQNDLTLTNNWQLGGSLPPRAGIDNGSLSVRVLTSLTAPASGAVNILFYIRGGDNFEYANPTEHIGYEGSNIIPSFFALQAEDKTNVVAAKYVIGTPTVTLPERYAQNFGECVGSLRNLLHRHTLLATDILTTSNGYKMCNHLRLYKRMPYTPGYVTASAYNANKIKTVGLAPYVFGPMSHLPYISGMYLGYRGSTNYVVTPSTDSYGFTDSITVSRCTNASSYSSIYKFFVFEGGVLAGASEANTQRSINSLKSISETTGLGGSAITSNRTNASLTFNLPDFNNYNFSLVDPSFYMNGSTIDGTDDQGAIVNILRKNTNTAATDTLSTVQTFAAAGPDFTCINFLCCPTMFYANSIPTA